MLSPSLAFARESLGERFNAMECALTTRAAP